MSERALVLSGVDPRLVALRPCTAVGRPRSSKGGR
jgi:hypothetical protein